ncbi:MAG: hypothetical protein U0527_06520 [Candidatus Eisenbacteria bacterium]
MRSRNEARWCDAAHPLPLSGAHEAVDCGECHQSSGPGELTFGNLDTECRACHLEDYSQSRSPDHRAGHFPTDCQRCHDTRSWETATFDHELTAFPPGQRMPRRSVPTATDRTSTSVPRATGVSCHRGDFDRTTAPPHAQADFSLDCSSCHGVDRWEGARFDHGQTLFPLRGAHADATCDACHSDGVYVNRDRACASCHQADYDGSADPNHRAAGFPTDCTTCHTETAWQPSIFDHTWTRFALTGPHARPLPRLPRHGGLPRQDRLRRVPSRRLRANDRAAARRGPVLDRVPRLPQRGSLGRRDLRSPRTLFPLTGTHATDLRACRRRRICREEYRVCRLPPRRLPGASDPNHRTAGFPTDCAHCHDSGGWRPSSASIAALTAFPLTGAHQAQLCSACHGDGVYAGRSTACVSCHQADFSGTSEPAHEPAGFSSDCTGCHTTVNWTGATYDHALTLFPLTGAHTALACGACHGDRVFAGKDTQCAACHQADFNATTAPPHAAANFSRDCQSCHTTTAWSGASFDHSNTLFPLTEAHAALACADCHSDGVYVGKSTACVACHQGDYDAAREPDHRQAGFPDACVSCHTMTAWRPSLFDHALTAFPLTGAHQLVPCSACHADNVWDGKPTACVACHQADYDATTEPHHAAAGFSTDCTSCHTVDRWEGATFDHGTTSFPLTGAHLGKSCGSCHADAVYRGKDAACVSCHRDDRDATTNPDHRAAQFADNCLDCHSTTSFDGASYDHDQTGFPLRDAHQGVACMTCHADGVFNGRSPACDSCHHDDYLGTTAPSHSQQGFPTDCSTCHNAVAWQPSIFDHALTLFPLTGAHQLVPCLDCHRDQVWHGKNTNCVSCHQADYDGSTNPHHASAGFATTCQDCHSTTTWEGATFDHGTTDFPLVGQHIGLACQSCHADGVYAGKSQDCYSCHQTDWQGTTDPPHQSAGFPHDCALCHTPEHWEPSSFDHANTLFPLTGAHASQACSACHADNVWGGKPTDCWSCHSTDFNGTDNPQHGPAGFSHNCTDCHTTSTWDGGTYNHNATDFPLTGQHVGAECSACHSDRIYNGKSTQCYSCHQSDWQGTTSPNHQQAGFPTDCSPCHSTEHWQPATFNHANTLFPLTGAHQLLPCSACHADNVWGGKPTDCWSCHSADFSATDNPHHTQAGFSHTCTNCHATSTWDGGTFNHNATDFPLTGQHVGAECSACHGDGVYNGKSTQCYSCHLTDWQGTTNPKHQQAGFPTDCTLCHSTARWQPSTFNHANTLFPLTGAHQLLPCSACHADNVWNGKPTDCWSCHSADFNATNNPHHVQAGFSSHLHQLPHDVDLGWRNVQSQHDRIPAHRRARRRGVQRLPRGRRLQWQVDPVLLPAIQTDWQGTTAPNHQQAGFPTDCTLCHSTARWQPSTFNHANTLFPLTGAHLLIPCSACHGDNVWDGKPTDCWSCHSADFNATNNPHHVQAGFSHTCTNCHTTSTWDGGTFNHNTTGFPLTGAHQAALCSDCHGDAVYDGKSTQCYSCHQSDWQGTTTPNHQQAGFPTDCTLCHGTDHWQPSTFNHANTLFPLTGAHLLIPCSACHGDNVWDGKPTDCWSCHSADFNGTTDPNHQTLHFPHTCQQCHSTSHWDGATFDHDGPYFPIYSGAHRSRWASCATCHTNPNNYQDFNCLGCHPHSDRQETDGHHQGRQGYQYESHACYNCHPRGRS